MCTDIQIGPIDAEVIGNRDVNLRDFLIRLDWKDDDWISHAGASYWTLHAVIEPKLLLNIWN